MSRPEVVCAFCLRPARVRCEVEHDGGSEAVSLCEIHLPWAGLTTRRDDSITTIHPNKEAEHYAN